MWELIVLMHAHSSKPTRDEVAKISGMTKSLR